MALKEILNQKTNKFKYLTPIAITILIVITIAILGIVVYINDIDNNAVKLFERAYIKIKDFDDADFNKKQTLSADILKTLDRVVVKFPSTLSSKRALFYKGYVLFHIEKYEDAEKALLTFISTNKKNSLTPKAYYILSYCYSERKDNLKAIETLKVFEKDYYDSAYTPLAFYELGFLYENQNDKDNAVKYYQKIVSEFSKSPQADYAKKKVVLLANDIKLTDKKYFN